MVPRKSRHTAGHAPKKAFPPFELTAPRIVRFFLVFLALNPASILRVIFGLRFRDQLVVLFQDSLLIKSVPARRHPLLVLALHVLLERVLGHLRQAQRGEGVPRRHSRALQEQGVQELGRVV